MNNPQGEEVAFECNCQGNNAVKRGEDGSSKSILVDKKMSVCQVCSVVLVIALGSF